MFTAAALSLSCHSALGAQARESGEYSHTFGAADYKMNRDGVKEEIPVNGTCRITPRLPDMGVLTHFQVPEGEQTLAEWSVTASVLSSDGPAAGVALWSGGSGCVLSFYPDGRGYLRGYKGREVSWSQDISVRGFSFPADITLERDANGSVLGRVNGIIAAARVLDVNLKKPSGDRVTTVSFATRSTKERPGAAATYGTLEVNGWGRAGSAVF
jgi:hypothetical protein